MPSNRAFTLLELLVVITIIGILSSIVIVSMSGSTDSAEIAKGKAYAQQVHALLGANAVGVWNFDEEETGTCSDGSDVCDISGYGNNGTLVGNPQYVESEIEGNAMYFGGTGNYVNCGSDASLDITDKITVEGWIKRNSSPSLNIEFARKYSASGGYLLAPGQGSQIYWYISPLANGSTGGYTNPDVYSLTEWSHIVGTFVENGGNNNWKVYVNGIVVSQKTFSGAVGSSAGVILSLGNNGDGIIDGVRIYAAALPSTEIQKHYVQGLENLLVNQAITQTEYDQRMEEFNQYLSSNRF